MAKRRTFSSSCRGATRFAGRSGIDYAQLADDMAAAEAADDAAVAAAYYSASGGTGLENQLSQLEQAYNVAEGAARVTQIGNLVANSPSAWASLALAEANNAQTYFVVQLGAQEQARELAHANAENIYLLAVDSLDRAQWLSQVQWDEIRALAGAANFGQAMDSAGGAELPGSFTPPQLDLDNVRRITDGYSATQPGQVSANWGDSYGWWGYYGLGSPGLYTNIVAPWWYSWVYNSSAYNSAFASPYSYFAGLNALGIYGGPYYAGGWNYAYAFGWGGWSPSYSAQLTGLSANTTINVQAQLDDFDQTLSMLTGRIDGVLTTLTLPQDQAGPVIDPGTGAVQFGTGVSGSSGTSSPAAGDGAEDANEDIPVERLLGSLAMQQATFNDAAATDGHGPLPRERETTTAEAGKLLADPKPRPTETVGNATGVISADIVQSLFDDEKAVFVPKERFIYVSTTEFSPGNWVEAGVDPKGYAVVRDIVGDRIVTFILEKRPQGDYRVIYQSPLGSPIDVNVSPDQLDRTLKAFRSPEMAQLLVNALVKDPENIQAMKVDEAELTFALNLVPGGAAIDHSIQGQTGEALISLAGDAALFLGGPLKAFAAARGYLKTAQGFRATAVALEGGIGVTRLNQSYYAFQDGRTGQAAGYLGEGVLRLFSITVQFRSTAVPIDIFLGTGSESGFRKLVGWGVGARAAVARATNITSEEVRAMGMTKEVAEYWLGFYKTAVARGRGAATAHERVKLMERIIELLD